MELKWRRTTYHSLVLWWDERTMRCAEVQPVKTNAWSLTVSYHVAPLDFNPDRARFDTLEEAKEYTENLVRVLIIGGHHERN